MDENQSQKFKLLSSEEVLKGRAFTIRKDHLELPDGRVATYDIVEHIGAVTLIPVDDQSRILFVKQYRPPAGEFLLELPAGTLKPDEDPLLCAARELREETGMAARNIRLLNEFWLAPGYSTEYMRIYKADDLYPAPLDQDDDEFLSVEAVPLPEALQMIDTGKIRDAKTILGVLLIDRVLRHSR
jgi:ADP-ribose pyrophosphatase